METFQCTVIKKSVCDQEECLRDVVHNAAGRLGLPTRVTAVEQSQAKGRAEQRVRAPRERLQIMVEDARRCGVETIRDHPIAQWAVRHAKWIQNFLVKSDVDLSDGGTQQITPHEAHTGDKAQSNVVGFLERVPFRSKSNDDKQPRFLVGWALGHKDADIITLMEDGSVRYKGSLKYSPERRSDANVHELQSALAKMRKHETKGARLLGM